MGFIVQCKECMGDSCRARSAGSTDTVTVIFDGEWEGNVEDVFDGRDIYSSGL